MRSMIKAKGKAARMEPVWRPLSPPDQSSTAAATDWTIPQVNFTEFEGFKLPFVVKVPKTNVAESAEALGLSTLWMPSGAGHDAQSIAPLAPTGMIFIPSVDGISHSRKEYSRPGDIENGANVLLHTILEIDRGL